MFWNRDVQLMWSRWNDAQYFRFHSFAVQLIITSKKLGFGEVLLCIYNSYFFMKYILAFLNSSAQNKSCPIIARMRSMRVFSERHYIYYEGGKKIYCCKISHGGFARPSGKGNLQWRWSICKWGRNSDGKWSVRLYGRGMNMSICDWILYMGGGG